MNKINYYNVLGVDYKSSHDKIKKAYHKLAKTQHPDVGGSIEKMKLINEAYYILGNPEKKLQYDNQMLHSLTANIKNNHTTQPQQENQEKEIPIYDKYQRNGNNPKFHRTDFEKKMSMEFWLQNASAIKRYENEIYCSKSYDKTKNFIERIHACDKAIQSFYDFQKFCYSSEGGTIYFQDHWEYCHNSHNECFSFVETLERQKKKLQKQNENNNRKIRKASLLDGLENDLYELIEMEQPILQSLLFTYYDASIKNDIKKILDEWESYDAIKRTKYKNSYMIELL